MNIIFFEVQDWEQELLKSMFPNATLLPEKLSPETASSHHDAEIISPFIYSTLTNEVLQQLPHLKFIATRSTGYDHIDMEYCKKKGIVVSNVPEYGSNTVAEHTFALLLSLTRKIYQSVNQSKNLQFEHQEIRGVDLCGKTIGIIGMGKIGHQVLRIAQGFSMNVLVYNRTCNTEEKRYTCVTLDELLPQSDVITLHLPLLPETKHIINKENILTCKPGSYLINTARGGLIDTEAIMIGLNKNILAGVGLDVLEEENELNEEIALLNTDYKKDIDLKTLVYNHILINHPKVLITPHNAFNSIEALIRIAKTTISNIQNYLSSTPSNMV